MPQYLAYIVFIGAAVQLIGVAAYVKETLRGNTKPNRVTWFLWSVAPLIATSAAIFKGVKLSVLPVFMSGFGPFLVLLASFISKKSYWKLKSFDYLCGACSILALIFWGITKEPNSAILFAVVSDALAAIPTLIKSWKYPETETVGAYTTGLFNAFTSFFAMKTWSFAEMAFPFYLVIVSSCLVISVSRKNFFSSKKPT